MFGMTDIRCLLGCHAWGKSAPSFRMIGLHHGVWMLRRKCDRCGAKMLIEGPAAEIKAGIRSRSC